MKIYNGRFGVIDNPKGQCSFPHAITVQAQLLDHREPYSKDNPYVLWRSASGISEIEYEIDDLIRDLQSLKKKARKTWEKERLARIAARS